MTQKRENLRAKAASTFTNKGRYPSQEDFLLSDREKGIFVVADGFGGPNPGAQAAKAACEAVRNFLFKEAGDLDATLPFVLRKYFSLAGNVLFNSLIYANRKVSLLNKEKNVHERGGASVIAGFIDGDLLAIANVGVCTAWMFRNGLAKELVMPRSYGKLCDPFKDEVKEEHRAPLIALGMSEDLEPEIVEYKVKQGDWLVFATDGIKTSVYQQMLYIYQKKLNPEVAVQEVSKILGQNSFEENASLSLVVF